MTKTLTEQWCEGTLERGYYYYKTKADEKVVGYQCSSLKFPYDYNNNTIDTVKEVLSAVPSYDEYKQLVSKTDELVQKMHILEKRLENTTNVLEELETKSDKLYRGSNDWTLVEQLDFIKAKCQETLYQLKGMEGVK